MFKYAKITLLALAAFLVLGFSITANAAKPTPVEVMNTPDVNVANTPEVTVANTPDVNVTNDEANAVPVAVVPDVREYYIRTEDMQISDGVQNNIVSFTRPNDRILVIENISIRMEQSAQSAVNAYWLSLPIGSSQCAIPLNLPTTHNGENYQGSQNIKLFVDPDSSFALQVNYSRNPTGGQEAMGHVVIQGYTLPLGSVSFPSSCL